MAAQPQPVIDPEATASDGFLFGDDDSAPGGRQLLSLQELAARLTALISSYEGCENVKVLEVYRIEPPDSRDGCNWSLAVMLDPAGVPPEIYSLAYGAVIATARASWNVEQEPDPDPGSGPQP